MVVAPASIFCCEYQLPFAVDIETNPMPSITPFLLAGSMQPLARQRTRNVPLKIATRSWCARLALLYRACFSQKDFGRGLEVKQMQRHAPPSMAMTLSAEGMQSPAVFLAIKSLRAHCIAARYPVRMCNAQGRKETSPMKLC